MAAAGRAAAAGVAGSRLLSLRGAALRPFPLLAPLPLSEGIGVGLVARSYVAVARRLGEGGVGRGLRRAASSWEVSFLAGGSWLRVVGACFVAGGIVRASLTASWREGLAGGLLAAAGLIAAARPRLLALGGGASVGGRMGVAAGLVAPDRLDPARGASWPEAHMRAGGPGAAEAVSGEGLVKVPPQGHRYIGAGWAVWLAAAAAAMAGGLSAAAGLDAFVTLVGAAVLVWLMAVVPFRGEFLLLVPAAFPWVDWLARNLLGPGLGSYWDEAFIVGGFAVAAFGALVLRRYEWRAVPITVPILAALTVAVGSILINRVPDQVAQFALRVTFQPFLFYYLAVWLPKDRRWVKATVAVFLGASVLLALHGLYQYVTNAPMPASWVDTHEDIGTRAYSIINNPNGLGGFLLLGIMLSGSLALSRVRSIWRMVCGAVAALLLAALAVTFSRGAYIGLVVGFVALALLAFRPWLARLFGAAVVLALLVPRRFWDRLLFGFSSYYLQLSATNGRLYVWRIALLRMAEHPWWGVGLGTLGGTSAYLAGYGRLWIDSYYLQLGAEGGVLLLLAFVWILARAGKGVVAAYLAEGDPFLRSLSAGVFGGFVAVCVAAFTTSIWETLVVGAGFWFLAGLASSLPPREDETQGLGRARTLRDQAPVGALGADRGASGRGVAAGHDAAVRGSTAVGGEA